MNRFFGMMFFALLVSGAGAEKLYYTTAQKQWGLSASAILTQRNHEDFYSMTGDPIIPRAVRRQKSSLNRWWGISSRKSLIKKMEWARDEGHRAEFEKIRADLDKPQWWVELRDQLLKKDLAYDYDYRREFVQEHGAALGDASLLAWDLARLVSLARWGVLCGYLEEAEAWEWIMPAALQLQETYDSWEQLAENYLLGREFWSEYYTFESGHKYQQAAYWALNNEFSPWKKLYWDMDLAGVQYSALSDSELPEASAYFVAAHRDWDGKPAEALELLHAVTTGDGEDFYRGEAFDRLGNFYEHGRDGIEKNWDKALEYYSAGAELGNADCLFEVGFAHYRGRGRKKDFGKAMEFWQAAADAGNVDGLTNVGMLYSDGEGVEKDIGKAAALYEKATRWGATVSENNLAWMMYKNDEIWDADEAVDLAYNAIYKWECNSHYDTLVKVLIKAEEWSWAWHALNDWEKLNMRGRDNYDPLKVPEKYKRFRAKIQAGLGQSS